jgi:hypothetical protein
MESVNMIENGEVERICICLFSIIERNEYYKLVKELSDVEDGDFGIYPTKYHRSIPFFDKSKRISTSEFNIDIRLELDKKVSELKNFNVKVIKDEKIKNQYPYRLKNRISNGQEFDKIHVLYHIDFEKKLKFTDYRCYFS